MRALFCLALLVGCVDDSTNNHEDLAVSTEDLRVFIHLDLSGRGEEDLASEDLRSEPDMVMLPVSDMIMLTGCNGLVTCYVGCNSDATCMSSCDARSTPHAQNLLTIVSDCVDAHCFNVNYGDSGAPACTDTSTDAPACQDCLNKVYGVGGACVPAYDNCLADKP